MPFPDRRFPFASEEAILTEPKALFLKYLKKVILKQAGYAHTSGIAEDAHIFLCPKVMRLTSKASR